MLIFPVPTSILVGAIKFYYNRLPTDVSDNADTPEIPVLYHSVLVDYCLIQAYEMDEDPELSVAKQAAVDRDIATLRGRTDWKQQDFYPVITVLPEDL